MANPEAKPPAAAAAGKPGDKKEKICVGEASRAISRGEEEDRRGADPSRRRRADPKRRGADPEGREGEEAIRR
ncbi:hypothetical protein M758_5G052800 [Ceratodon purpureus]|nr:hypothetical protein M758_5G052800 [Ceratodon purpureus]